jgi:S13-like H2TH domain
LPNGVVEAPLGAGGFRARRGAPRGPARPGRQGSQRACSLARISSPTNDPLGAHRAAPERSLDQRINALRRANEVRTLRAQLKRDLKAGRVSIGALLLDPPPYLQTAKVFDMLLALPKVGRVKAAKIMNNCRVSTSKTFGGLSDRQRAELAERLNQ